VSSGSQDDLAAVDFKDEGIGIAPFAAASLRVVRDSATIESLEIGLNG
jgi:hypothetical protein